MAETIGNMSLIGAFKQGESIIYSLESGSFRNSYFIVSSPGTRRLMASPEVVGYDSYLSMVPATRDALACLRPEFLPAGGGLDILTILRGGLNYPLEECCHSLGIRVDNMQFVSCERIIEDGQIKGLDLKYEKLVIHRDCTLMIGDIIATGDTFRRCLEEVVGLFHRCGGSIRKVVVFTVGGTRAIPLLEGFTQYARSVFPSFEGVTCIFYEGAFGLYGDKGVSGVNVPDIDFGWKGGCISPEFRDFILSDPDALFEKCIIYDGGARRYEISLHCREVLDYWNDLLAAAPGTSWDAFIEEKAGHPLGLGFEEWLSVTGYGRLQGLEELYRKEASYLEACRTRSLEEICRRRAASFADSLSDYIKTDLI